MKNEFVPYEQALALKELGFDEPCFTFYPKEGKMGFDGKYHSIKEGYRNSTVNDIWIKRYKKDFECVAAPTFSQTFRWFRKKYELRHSITDFIDDETGIEWDYEIAIIGTDSDENGNYKPLVDYSVDDETRKFKTYEEAELACLIKLIEIVKNK